MGLLPTKFCPREELSGVVCSRDTHDTHSVETAAHSTLSHYDTPLDTHRGPHNTPSHTDTLTFIHTNNTLTQTQDSHRIYTCTRH